MLKMENSVELWPPLIARWPVDSLKNRLPTMTFRQNVIFLRKWPSRENGSYFPDDHDGINPQHSERSIENRLHISHRSSFITDEIRQFALRIQMIDVDGCVNEVIFKRRQITR
jgi:hypothetical protein